MIYSPAEIALAASLAIGTPSVEPTDDAQPSVDLRDGLHAKQREVWDAVEEARRDGTMRRIRVLWSRRTGKSHVVIRLACYVAQQTPDGVVPYISITRKHAKINFWKLFKRLAKQLDSGCKINESDLTIDFDGGGMVWLGGADKIDELEKYRASMCPLAIVDEMQRFPSGNARYLIEEVLGPAMFDLGAPIIESGTPGKTMLRGIYWFDATGDHADDVFRANVYDNEFFANVEEKLAIVRKERGWTVDSPQYVREYLGKWANDEEGKVYPFKLERNGIDALPIRNHKGNLLDVNAWRYVVAVDPAGKGITGLAVVAAHPDIVGTFLVESESHQGMMIDALAARCRALRAKHPRALFVMDVGGLGSTHAQEFSRKFAFYVKPAQKTQRSSAVRFAHDEVLSGRMKVINGECNDAWRGEAAVIGWDDDHEDHEDGSIDHVCDCVLYATRELHPVVGEESEPDLRDATTRLADDIATIRRKYSHPKQSTRPSWDR